MSRRFAAGAGGRGLSCGALSLALLAGAASGALPDRPGDASFPTKTAITQAGAYAVAGDGHELVLSGAIAGDVTISADSPCRVTLDGVALAGQLAIAGEAILWAKGASTLDNAGGAVVTATGELMLAGDGAATLTGGGAKAKNAVVYSKDALTVAGGTWNVNMSFATAAKGFGLAAAKKLKMVAGTVNVVSACTDYKDTAVSSEKKNVVIAGGVLRVTQAGPKSVAIGADAADAAVRMTGGAVYLSVAGAGAKGVRCEGAFEMSGGLLEATVSGGPLYEPYECGEGTNLVVTTSEASLIASATYLLEDVTSAAAVKCGAVRVSGGTVRVVADGPGSRGLVADATLDVSGGVFDIRANGAPSLPVVDLVADDDLSVVEIDRKTAACVKQGDPDGTATITGGTFYLVATNDGGKCLSADGALTIGARAAEGSAATRPTDAAFAPDIQCATGGRQAYVAAWGLALYETLGTAVATTDAAGAVRLSQEPSRVVVKRSDGSEYANPKCLKVDGGVTVESGRLRMQTSCDGGEGLESKAALTVNGGVIEGVCCDDVIQAADTITVNGGYLYCGSTDNDSIDANDAVVVNGGVVLAFTLVKPEVGIDVEGEGKLRINGGVVLAVGSATKWQYGSSGTQAAHRNVSAPLATYAGKYLGIAGTDVWVKVPDARSTDGKCSLLCSAPGCTDAAPTVASEAEGTDIGFHGVHADDPALAPSTVVVASDGDGASAEAEGSGFVYDAFLADLTTAGLSCKSAEGEVYALEAAPLVDWVKADGDGVQALPTRPQSCNTEDLRAWLTNDVANLEAFLYADEIAADAGFSALAVSGTNFVVAAQDAATRSVARAVLQVSSDLATWRTASECIDAGGACAMPSSTNGFARLVYSLTW